jgi:flagellar L-ring protein precursor FlgH
MRHLPALLAVVVAVSGCGANLSEVGVPPRMSPVGSGIVETPRSAQFYPKAPAPPVNRASLWNDRQSRLFTDPRALSVGEVLTVMISINDRAKFNNESERKRQSGKTLGVGADYDLNGNAWSGSGGFDIGSTTNSVGSGRTARSEDLRLSIAAIVTDVLPNGNLVISGTQEVRVNAELRVLTIAGIVRPSDIGGANTIAYDRIAEARISYGGRGRLTEVQQPPYGQQILDQLLPF